MKLRPGASSVRGIFAGFLGLVALHAVGSKGGSGRVAEAFGDVAGGIERVLSPTVPAIPDRRHGAASHGGGAAAAISAGARITDRLPIPDPPK